MGARQFVLDTLSMALRIVDGDWDKERDWEVYVMARQSLLASIEFVRGGDIDVDKVAQMTMDDFIYWAELKDIYFYKYFPKTGDKWPMSREDILRCFRRYRDGEQSTSRNPADRGRPAELGEPEPRLDE